MRLKRRVQPFKQRGGYDCGPVCVEMALDSFLTPKKADYQEIKKYAKDSSAGTSRYGIKKAIRQLGFNCKETSLKVEDNYLTLQEKKKLALTLLKEMIKKDNPIILACTMREDGQSYGHYVVLIEIDDDLKYIHLNDPYYGKEKRVKTANFIKDKQKLNFGVFCRVFEVFEK